MAQHELLFMEMSEDVHGSKGRAVKAVAERVIRVQGDKLCEELGYPKGTKIDIEIIKEIAKLKAGDFVVVNGKSIKISPRIFAIAKILLDKIEG